jgi:uncharacterized membrane protein YeaQ/YmgE (transglycosylase-associated protein family)
MDEGVPERSVGRYVLGFVLTIGCLLVGNLLGYIVASIWGWENLDYRRPGGTAFGALQGAIGAAISLWAASAWLKDVKFADFWLRIFVWVGSGLIFVLVTLSVISGKFNLLLTWGNLATVANVVAVELTRRSMKNEFL